MKISIVGSGYVGLVTGACLADKGHEVICVDSDVARVAQINGGGSPIHEKGLQEILLRNVGTNLSATTDLDSAVVNSEITFIAVGTPFNGESIDLQFILGATRQIGDAIKKKNTYHTVVVKSTVVPGTTLNDVLPLLELTSGKTCGQGFGLAMNPEFLREGEAISDFNSPDRIVVGFFDESSKKILSEAYESFPNVEKCYVDLTTAEMIKYASNALFATLISFSNEIGNLSAAAGVDVVEVMSGVHADRRIMPLLDNRERIKPGIVSYLTAGCGFGGSCFPKDVKALIAYGKSMGRSMELLSSVIAINSKQPNEVLKLLQARFSDFMGLKVGILGLAFKPETDDLRESPSLAVADLLLKSGAKVMAYDPVASEGVRKLYGNNIEMPESLVELINSVDALLLMTAWSEFQELPGLLEGMDLAPFFIDGRRFIKKDLIKNYAGIGLRMPELINGV